MATHYTCLMGRCREKGGKDCLELASKASITLLRFSDFIPCDKCFYQARRCARVFFLCATNAFSPCCVSSMLPLLQARKGLGMMPPF